MMTQAQKLETLTDEQLRSLYQSATANQDELFMLMISTGLRIGELLALRWQDLNVETRTLTIPLFPSPRERRLRLPMTMVQRLEALQLRQEGRPGGFVFTTDTGTRLSFGMLRRRLHSLCVQAEIGTCGMHMLRNSTCMTLIELNIDATVVQAILGLKGTSLVKNLAPIEPEAIEGALQRLLDYLER